MTKKGRSSSERIPLTMDELERLTADDYVRLKLTDDERSRLRDINKARQQERNKSSARLKVEEEPILADLRAVGLNTESVWDLDSTSASYSESVPVLLKHLVLPYSDRTREGIAHALAVSEPEVRNAWPILVEEYHKAAMGLGIVAPGDTKEYRLGIKDGLACALSAAVTDETMEELIEIAKERAHGESRILLLSALRKSKHSLAKQALDELASDPDLMKEIAFWQR